jgi:hypothetical protein
MRNGSRPNVFNLSLHDELFRRDSPCSKTEFLQGLGYALWIVAADRNPNVDVFGVPVIAVIVNRVSPEDEIPYAG